MYYGFSIMKCVNVLNTIISKGKIFTGFFIKDYKNEKYLVKYLEKLMSNNWKTFKYIFNLIYKYLTSSFLYYNIVAIL